MDDKEEAAYIRGRKQAFAEMLAHAAREFHIDATDEEQMKSKLAFMVQERELAISALRNICSQYGDNDWSDNLFLPDIIEKHLHRALGFR